jgi:hypothetical protein
MLKKKKTPSNYINFNYYFSSKNYLKRFAGEWWGACRHCHPSWVVCGTLDVGWVVRGHPHTGEVVAATPPPPWVVYPPHLIKKKN